MTWRGRYRLPDGEWQAWASFETYEEAEGALEFHAQGREIEIEEEAP